MYMVLAEITVKRVKPLAGADDIYCDEKTDRMGVGGWVHPVALNFIPFGGHPNRKNGILFMLLHIDPEDESVICRTELTGGSVDLTIGKTQRVNLYPYGDFDLTLHGLHKHPPSKT